MSQSTSTVENTDTEFEAESGVVATLKELRHSPTALLGAVIIGIIVLMAAFSTIDKYLLNKQLITMLIADPQATDTTNIYAAPSMDHLMGTDRFGRDVFARIIYGSRIALAIGVVAVGISLIGGVGVGALAAYEGGYVDDVLMRLAETLYSIPALVFAMTLMAILGPSIYNLFFAYGIIGIPAYARVMRSEVLSIREEEYVDAARAAGLPRRTILFREIVPNGLAAVLVQATLSMGSVIIGAAALSFLGFGVQPPTASWGQMLNSAQQALVIAPWVAVFPGLMIFLTVMGFNLLGDGLRDAMDPRTNLRSPDPDELEAELLADAPNVPARKGDPSPEPTEAASPVEDAGGDERATDGGNERTTHGGSERFTGGDRP
ncbi:ABC transporter permease [Halococcus agarilyticus]|uniref:ABC transporter permease n=1 Tax=Halococcus agarilyticus TaxID=1232219 RepID=UPI0006779301|nr:ABC transporter permease [Halococcus agarilyticus]